MVSTTAVMETQCTEQFRAFIENAAGLPIRVMREEAFAVFRDIGFPTPKSEDWKYTNVEPIGKADWRAKTWESNNEILDPTFLKLFRGFNFERNGFAALNLA